MLAVFVSVCIVAAVLVPYLVNERGERKAAECNVQQYVVTELRDLIIFTTEPADLTGLSPERVQVVQTVNKQREEFRLNALKIIPEVKC